MDVDEVGADRFWTEVSFPEFTTMQKQKKTLEEMVCTMVAKEKFEMGYYKTDWS